ncbi:glycosyltransferase family 4 protein [Pseudomonas fluorescens]|jgi:Fuc2NAc and GlcNAc transferase|uniref:MraY family glycosyltransferase n=1 Tax=Pseudomonas TaxID=286 RepID=UPI000EAAB903|nr:MULTISPECIES: glycosyltransferase family 4 protein [Pseudomonas]AYG07310.1 glycosyltransferase family 4 protein [Pseudomonas fluorescens]MDZ4316952.1 glycosyltransferase family 4 protein [Azonexus sp.]MBJ2263477.1 glycosyltransferase family 4 protein [Pseudomonas sp. MF6787]MBK3457135.1 glycosyltransferase family 4 protein [Pseudomonas sp. MF6754]MDI3206289.1 glycosyltransferase family 4 protein [Pseudomonas shahriarae]
MKYWYIFPIVALASLLLTAVLRQYALRRSIIDIPNARSSHTVPTPRGGGVAIVLTFALSLLVLALLQLVSIAESVALLGSGLLIAVIGFMDDHGHIAARWRLLGHFIAAAWALFWMQGLPAITFFGFSLSLGWLGHLLGAFYLVWMLNLYNFMDGIDGIASLEAICACGGLSLIYFLSGHEALIWAPLLLAMAVVGFLYWNFPPARIFMGDAGSGFLGIVLGGLSIQAAWVGSEFFFAWLIMLGVFVVDATFTLGRRLARGDKVYEAHRSHAYQFASRQFGKHLPVTVSVGVINVVWLFPLALCVTLLGLDGALGVVIAYVPLLLLAVKYKAGMRE